MVASRVCRAQIQVNKNVLAQRHPQQKQNSFWCIFSQKREWASWLICVLCRPTISPCFCFRKTIIRLFKVSSSLACKTSRRSFPEFINYSRTIVSVPGACCFPQRLALNEIFSRVFELNPLLWGHSECSFAFAREIGSILPEKTSRGWYCEMCCHRSLSTCVFWLPVLVLNTKQDRDSALNLHLRLQPELQSPRITEANVKVRHGKTSSKLLLCLFFFGEQRRRNGVVGLFSKGSAQCLLVHRNGGCTTPLLRELLSDHTITVRTNCWSRSKTYSASKICAVPRVWIVILNKTTHSLETHRRPCAALWGNLT